MPEPQRGQQRLTKLILSPAGARRLDELAAFRPPRASPPQSERIVTTYFDTPNRDLARRGLSLRVRRAGEKRISGRQGRRKRRRREGAGRMGMADREGGARPRPRARLSLRPCPSAAQVAEEAALRPRIPGVALSQEGGEAPRQAHEGPAGEPRRHQRRGHGYAAGAAAGGRRTSRTRRPGRRARPEPRAGEPRGDAQARQTMGRFPGGRPVLAVAAWARLVQPEGRNGGRAVLRTDAMFSKASAPNFVNCYENSRRGAEGSDKSARAATHFHR